VITRSFKSVVVSYDFLECRGRINLALLSAINILHCLCILRCLLQSIYSHLIWLYAPCYLASQHLQHVAAHIEISSGKQIKGNVCIHLQLH
jgi:hypothetical protein